MTGSLHVHLKDEDRRRKQTVPWGCRFPDEEAPRVAQRKSLRGLPSCHQTPFTVNYVRSALTYGAIFCLIGLLLLFFGGLLLGGESRLPAPRGGWAGGGAGVDPVRAGMLFVALGAGLGMLVALWVQASWGETAAVLVIIAGGVWAFGPAGVDEVGEVLWRIGRVWNGILEWGPDPGWGP